MQQTFRIIDEDGIHARPATALVNTANKFQDTNSLPRLTAKSNAEVDSGRSVLGLEQGDTLTLITEGGNESEALTALQEVMVNEGLGELHE